MGEQRIAAYTPDPMTSVHGSGPKIISYPGTSIIAPGSVVLFPIRGVTDA